MKEEEIRPRHIFEEYLRLCKADTKTFFSEAETIHGKCPACEMHGEIAFIKDGFSYELCSQCKSLFVNPRPVAESFTKYYLESPSSKYWATTFYRDTADARREQLWKPKARLIRETLKWRSAEEHSLIDIGGGFGLFAEEMRTLTGRAPVVIEPGPHLAAVCREKGLQVIEAFLEEVSSGDLPLGPKVFVSFELFEHLHDPAAFLKQLHSLMASGDLFIFTTLSGTGVDIQALWQDSKAVSPPHHLNFLNPRSVELLLTRLEFDEVEVTTPGKLDIDILVNNREHIKDRFWQTFVDSATVENRGAWQSLIASSGWSSHMMVVCRKP